MLRASSLRIALLALAILSAGAAHVRAAGDSALGTRAFPDCTPPEAGAVQIDGDVLQILSRSFVLKNVVKGNMRLGLVLVGVHSKTFGENDVRFYFTMGERSGLEWPRRVDEGEPQQVHFQVEASYTPTGTLQVLGAGELLPGPYVP